MTTLVAKIAQASIKVGALKTDKTNTQQNYNYISADKILERAGDALASAGIVIMPSITDESTVQVDYTDNYGKARTRFDSLVQFNMIVTDGETQMELSWRGRGNDYAVPDKALYKAITSGHKYFLMKLLNVGVGNEDGEHDDGQAAQDAQKPATARKSAQTPVTPGAPDVAFTEPKKPLATQAQLEELDALGKEFYANEWEERLPALIEAVSKGATTDARELLQMEIAKLINGIRTKMAAQSNGVTA